MSRKARRAQARQDRLDAAKHITDLFFQEMQTDGNRHEAWNRTAQTLALMARKQSVAEANTYALARAQVTRVLGMVRGVKTKRPDVYRLLEAQ